MPSIFSTVSPRFGVQLDTGGLPRAFPNIIEADGPAIPDAFKLAFAMLHRLPGLSWSLLTLAFGCWFWECGIELSAGNRYDTPGSGVSRPRGPIIWWDGWKGDGPRSLEILLYTSEITSTRDMRVSW